MATAETSALPSPLLEQLPSATKALQFDHAQTFLIQEQLSLHEQQHLVQHQAQIVDLQTYVCEWTPTNLRLPSQDAQQDIYLCLPVHLTEASYFKQNEGKEESKDDGYCSNSVVQLRLAELDRYLAAVSPLALSTKRLLVGASSVQENEREVLKPFQNKRHDNNYLLSKQKHQGQPTMYQSGTSRHRLITSTNLGRVLNVLQGEIAHCTPSQSDVLVSDDATTCHIVALWSRYVTEGEETAETISSRVLATMAHIDGVGYETSLRDAVNEHIKYHSSHSPNQTVENNIEECKESCTSGVIEMSIHIMGGFNDEEGSSIEITDNLLRTFAALSNQCLDYSVSKGLPRVRMTLETCAVASANDDGTGCPLGRGLAIEVATGNIFLAEVEDVVDESLPTPSAVAAVASRLKFPGVGKSKSNANTGCGASAEGPEVTLRSMRLWASSFHSQGREKKHLNVIFRPDSDCLCIEPFFFGPHSTAKRLLDCSDDQLLQITSTSPEVEKDNFVRKVREALTYMNSNRSSSVFGVDQPIAYRRVGLNGWVRSS